MSVYMRQGSVTSDAFSSIRLASTTLIDPTPTFFGRSLIGSIVPTKQKSSSQELFTSTESLILVLAVAL